MGDEKKSKKGLIITLILIAIIVAGAILAYTLVFNTPEYVINKSIDKLFATSEDNNEEIKTLKSNLKLKLNIDTNDASTKEIANTINEVGLGVDTQLNLEQKKSIVSLGLDYQNKNEVTAQIYADKENVYLSLKELFDKNIDLSDISEEVKQVTNAIAELETIKPGSNKADKILSEEIKGAIKEYGEISKESETVKIKGEDTKVSKNTVTISGKSLKSALESIIKNLKNNDEFIKCFASSPVEYLDQLLKSIEKETIGTGNLVISIFTKGLMNETVGFEIGDRTKSAITVIKQEEGTYEFAISGLDNSGKPQKGTLKINKIKDTGTEVEGTVTLTLEDISSTNISIICDYSLKLNEKIDEVNVGNKVVKADEITAEDLQKITEAAEDKPLINMIIGTYSMMSGLNSSYDDYSFEGGYSDYNFDDAI